MIIVYMWVNMETIMMNEMSQRERARHRMIQLTCGYKIKNTMVIIPKRIKMRYRRAGLCKKLGIKNGEVHLWKRRGHYVSNSWKPSFWTRTVYRKKAKLYAWYPFSNKISNYCLKRIYRKRREKGREKREREKEKK